jgi:excisionase family DNA binding protein
MDHLFYRSVWKHSKARGGALLTLLAIAYSIDDKNGYTYITEETIAEKTRMSARQVRRHIRRLDVDFKEICVEYVPGKGCKYHITIGDLPCVPVIERRHKVDRNEKVMKMSDALLTYREVASILTVSPATIRNWTLDGLIASIKVGRKAVRYRRSDVEAFLRAGQRPAT